MTQEQERAMRSIPSRGGITPKVAFGIPVAGGMVRAA